MSFMKNLFGKQHGVKDVITLFHQPSNAASVRVQTLLKQAAGAGAAHATEDQASSHNNTANVERTEFELDVTESAPTADQFRNISEYMGGMNAAKLIRDAKDEADAIRKLSKDPSSFQRPVVVDWHNGKAVAGDNESEIMKLIRQGSK